MKYIFTFNILKDESFIYLKKMKKTLLKTIVEWIQIREKEKTKQRNYQDKKKLLRSSVCYRH